MAEDLVIMEAVDCDAGMAGVVYSLEGGSGLEEEVMLYITAERRGSMVRLLWDVTDSSQVEYYRILEELNGDSNGVKLVEETAFTEYELRRRPGSDTDQFIVEAMGEGGQVLASRRIVIK
jgi:hypothetical protein